MKKCRGFVKILIVSVKTNQHIFFQPGAVKSKSSFFQKCDKIHFRGKTVESTHLNFCPLDRDFNREIDT